MFLPQLLGKSSWTIGWDCKGNLNIIQADSISAALDIRGLQHNISWPTKFQGLIEQQRKKKIDIKILIDIDIYMLNDYWLIVLLKEKDCLLSYDDGFVL